MKLTTTTQVSVDDVVQGNGRPDENRSGGCARGGCARLFNDTEHTATLALVEVRPVGLDVVLLRDHPAKG
jgi:hypothetical protein